MLRACATSLLLLAAAAPWSAAATTLGDAGAGAAPSAPRPDDDTNTVTLWPLLQYETTPDGRRHVEVLGLYHRTTAADGSLISTNVLTWINAPPFKAVLPFYLQGQYWWATPMGAGWPLAGGGSTWWVTPFAHGRRDADGTLARMNILTWFQGTSSEGSYRALLPFYYDTTDCGVRHYGVAPFLFKGPGWDVEPPLLSGHWRNDDGSSCRWITPLVHVSTAADGHVSSMHALDYIQVGDCHWIAPLVWWIGHGGDHKWGVLGAFMRGRDWWASPILLSGSTSDGAGRSSMFTPWCFLHQDAEGRIASGLVLNCVFNRHGAIAPPFWWYGAGDHRYVGLLPLGWTAPQSTVLLAGLTAWWHGSDGGRTVWATPLVHVHHDADGHPTSWHAGPVVHDGRTDLVLPLAWRHRGDDGLRQGIFPLYWQWPGHHLALPLYADGRDWSVLAPIYARVDHDWFAPLLLSAHWRRDDGSAATWVTPLAHREADAQGRIAFERILTWVRTPTVRTLMPLWWSWHGNGGATRAVYAGAVSVRRDPGMGTTTALMPLCAAYHRGEQLDTSWPFQCVPFSAQRTDAGSELHVLWRAFFMRAQPGSTVVQVGPLWWSQTRSGASLRWSVLGGLVRQTCNYTKGTARVRVLWFFPVSGETHFQPESAPQS